MTSLSVILLKTVTRRHKAAVNMEKVKKNILCRLQVRWKEVNWILAFHSIIGWLIVPRALAKAGDIKTHSSVPPSVCHKNFNLAHIFLSINGRALILGMHDPCDKPFQLAPCCDLVIYSYVNSVSQWNASIYTHLLSGNLQMAEDIFSGS